MQGLVKLRLRRLGSVVTIFAEGMKGGEKGDVGKAHYPLLGCQERKGCQGNALRAT